jgi:muramoyltetrapeptide carboxypeptidase
MAHIYIFSPSSAVRDKAAFRRGLKRLKAQGHEVEVDEAALDSHMRFAGDDATRIAAITRAAASGADVALISRGGYGLTRILPALPYKQIAKAIDGGMQFVGLSDFTAFNQAVYAKTGRISWQGPALGEDFGPNKNPTTSCKPALTTCCWSRVRAQAGSCPRPRPSDRVRVKDAPLWGGNLTVLTSLLGTPYFPQVKGGVLFLEDVGEHPYR